MANSGTPITNPWATTDVPTNYEIDDRTGFKMYPGELIKDGHIPGFMVSKKAHDGRHPQESVRSGRDRQSGPQSSELDNVFVSDGEVTADDL